MAKLKYNVRPVRRAGEDPFVPSVYPDRSGGPEPGATQTNADANTAHDAHAGNVLPDPDAAAFTASPGTSHKPKTEAQSGGGSGGLTDAYTDLYGKLKEYGVTSIPALDEFIAMMDGFLRPQTDSAIASRRAAADAGMAEMDADAYSRGMGASSYLSSVKSRERAASEADIAGLEEKYSSSMAEYLYKAVGSMREMESDIAKTRMKLAAEKEAAEEKRRYEEQQAKEKREYEAAKEKEKREYESAREKEKREYEERKAKAANDAKLVLAREKAKADRETKLAVAEKKAAASLKLQKQKEKQAVKIAKLKSEASKAVAKIRNSSKTKSSSQKKDSKAAQKEEIKYGHNKNGAYFDGKWYEGDWSYMKRGHTYKEYSNYLKGLTKSERYLFFTSSSREWRIRRWQVQYELPQADYNDLYAAYMPKGAAGTGKTSSVTKGAKKGGGSWKRVVS